MTQVLAFRNFSIRSGIYQKYRYGQKVLWYIQQDENTTVNRCTSFTVHPYPKWYFPYDIIFDIKTTSLIRPLLGSPKGDLDIRILL